MNLRPHQHLRLPRTYFKPRITLPTSIGGTQSLEQLSQGFAAGTPKPSYSRHQCSRAAPFPKLMSDSPAFGNNLTSSPLFQIAKIVEGRQYTTPSSHQPHFAYGLRDNKTKTSLVKRRRWSMVIRKMTSCKTAHLLVRAVRDKIMRMVTACGLTSGGMYEFKCV